MQATFAPLQTAQRRAMQARMSQILAQQQSFSADALHGPVEDIARALLGAVLQHRSADGQLCRGRIVETEAYGAHDPASHAAKGMTVRNAAMFAAAGSAYVYRSYGIHWCVNISCNKAGIGEAVLVRALLPLSGMEAMQNRRGETCRSVDALCRGPGNVCRAMHIDSSHNGICLLDAQAPLQLLQGEPVPDEDVVATRRIGISRNADALWRFYRRSCRAVSGRRTP